MPLLSRKAINLFYCLWLIATYTHAEEQFLLDKNLLPSLYNTSRQETTGYTQWQASVYPQFSWLTPLQIELENKYFYHLSYQRNIPLCSLGFSTRTPFWQAQGFALHGQLSVGYGYTENLTQVSSQSGALLTEQLRLHIVPVFLAFRPEYSANWWGLYLQAGVGGQVLAQNGWLDGMQQNYWLWMKQGQAGLRIIRSTETDASLLQELRLGISYQSPITGKQRFKTWSIDVGTSMFL